VLPLGPAILLLVEEVTRPTISIEVDVVAYTFRPGVLQLEVAEAGFYLVMVEADKSLLVMQDTVIYVCPGM
jgi:hypothetical protein